jgi:uncharacterized protein involved in exopolysaccharide biosynthesis
MDRAVDLSAQGRLTVAGLLAQIRERPGTFVASALLTVATVVMWAYFLAVPVYRGTVKMMPRENDAGGGMLQNIIGQVGGLASMAGLSLGSVNEQESIAWLKSRALFTLFANQQKLLPILFPDKWDAAAGRWRPELKPTPTMDDAWAMFDSGIRRVNDDTKTRVITLDITWKDRHQAADWANTLVHLANEELRQRALQESEASIASLDDQLKQTDSVDLRQSIFRLREVQLNRSVLAKSRREYALTVLDPAVVPDERRFVSPRRFLMLVISIPLGLFVGACVVVTLQFAHELVGQMRQPRI